jgi:hypothetical protein
MLCPRCKLSSFENNLFRETIVQCPRRVAQQQSREIAGIEPFQNFFVVPNCKRTLAGNLGIEDTQAVCLILMTLLSCFLSLCSSGSSLLDESRNFLGLKVSNTIRTGNRELLTPRV